MNDLFKKLHQPVLKMLSYKLAKYHSQNRKDR